MKADRALNQFGAISLCASALSLVQLRKIRKSFFCDICLGFSFGVQKLDVNHVLICWAIWVPKRNLCLLLMTDLRIVAVAGVTASLKCFQLFMDLVSKVSSNCL